MISACSGRRRIPGRRRNARYHRFQDVVDALAGLGAGKDRVVRRQPDDVFDFLDHPLRLGRRQVDLVEHRNHGYALLGRRIAIGDRLRLDALRRVDDQQRALAGRERARHLVGEVDMPGSVDQVEVVDAAVARLVPERCGLRLDGDAPLALEVHRIEDLRLHLPLGQAPAALDEAVGQGRLAVIDVGDDRKVANVLHGVQKKGAPRSAPPLLCLGSALASEYVEF